MAIYLKIDGINGDATHKDHQRWIECFKVDYRIFREMQGKVGAGITRETGTPEVSDVSICKRIDSSSPYLMTMATTGVSKKATIHYVSTGAGYTYNEVTLSNCIVSGFNTSCDAEKPTEMFCLNFTAIEFKYTPYDEKNVAASPQVTSYDLATTAVG